jgi:hypothetical protein
MATEPRRACGYRKVRGLYFCGDGPGFPCDRLPFPLLVCPTCHGGIKQSRGWTWIDVAGLAGGVHPDCKDDFPCPFCMATPKMGKAGLLWIGEKFYPTPGHFIHEADSLGISKRIKAVPRNFKVGETWILLAHPKAIEQVNWDGPEKRFIPGIFRIFRPSRIELIITETQSKDAEFMADLEMRKICAVIVPDGDRDHQGTVYDDEEESEPHLPFDGGEENRPNAQ